MTRQDPIAALCAALNAHPAEDMLVAPQRPTEPWRAPILGTVRRSILRAITLNPDGYQPVETMKPWGYGQAVAIETRPSPVGTRDRRDRDAWRAAWTASGGVIVDAMTVTDIRAALRLPE